MTDGRLSHRPPSPPDLRTSLIEARSAVDRHWRQRILSGHEPTETELTVAYCEAAQPRITYVQFNPAEEGRVGADWFWWFIDGSGECFGVLVQAKKLLRRGSRWHIDFGYQSGDRQQLYKLLDAADLFDVPAAYALYRRHRIQARTAVRPQSCRTPMSPVHKVKRVSPLRTVRQVHRGVRAHCGGGVSTF